MQELRLFNNDIHTKEAVIDFIHAHINQVALERMYKKLDVAHIGDAKELIDSAFQALADEYGIKDKPREVSNQSR